MSEIDATDLPADMTGHYSLPDAAPTTGSNYPPADIAALPRVDIRDVAPGDLVFPATDRYGTTPLWVRTNGAPHCVKGYTPIRGSWTSRVSLRIDKGYHRADAAMRERYGITAESVVPSSTVPIRLSAAELQRVADESNDRMRAVIASERDA